MPKFHTNMTIEGEIVEKAKAAGINLSEAAERGIRDALRSRGHDVETIEEIRRKSREAERRIQEEAARRDEEAKKAYAAGHVVVDENTPPMFRANSLFFSVPQNRPGR